MRDTILHKEAPRNAPQNKARCWDGQHWPSVIACPLRSNLISIKIHSGSLPLHALYQIGTVLARFSACTSGLPYSEQGERGFNRSKCKTQGHKGSDEAKKPPYSGPKQGKGEGENNNTPEPHRQTCDTIYNVAGSYFSLREIASNKKHSTAIRI